MRKKKQKKRINNRTVKGLQIGAEKVCYEKKWQLRKVRDEILKKIKIIS